MILKEIILKNYLIEKYKNKIEEMLSETSLGTNSTDGFVVFDNFLKPEINLDNLESDIISLSEELNEYYNTKEEFEEKYDCFNIENEMYDLEEISEEDKEQIEETLINLYTILEVFYELLDDERINIIIRWKIANWIEKYANIDMEHRYTSYINNEDSFFKNYVKYLRKKFPGRFYNLLIDYFYLSNKIELNQLKEFFEFSDKTINNKVIQHFITLINETKKFEKSNTKNITLFYNLNQVLEEENYDIKIENLKEKLLLSNIYEHLKEQIKTLILLINYFENNSLFRFFANQIEYIIKNYKNLKPKKRNIEDNENFKITKKIINSTLLENIEEEKQNKNATKPEQKILLKLKKKRKILN